ncbi:lipocalin family protein [Xylophilus sp. GOD-11R]|uniref:lipocalin family protein n=1 Tax=Xylophilus sp. GOD-11R TaxID=3089814 RepID=UPI00298C340B|nr:lipocalin family protein [Xylophilus sp. GOD-11R]WPB56577.1 lipocalin family protein [Xylophilus sp. GOD-11R]
MPPALRIPSRPMRWVLALGMSILPLATLAAQPVAVPVVPHVDWPRYAGKWYELARLPNSFQRKCAANVTAEYRALPDGRLQVVNQCDRSDASADIATGDARRTHGDAGKLKVRFAPRWLSWLPAVWGDYWVFGLDEDYRTALVGTPDREYLWLLSRSPQRPEAEINAWIERAAALGFDARRVVRTTQTEPNAVPTAPPESPAESPAHAPSEPGATTPSVGDEP